MGLGAQLTRFGERERADLFGEVFSFWLWKSSTGRKVSRHSTRECGPSATCIPPGFSQGSSQSHPKTAFTDPLPRLDLPFLPSIRSFTALTTASSSLQKMAPEANMSSKGLNRSIKRENPRCGVNEVII